ncbi:HAD-IIB family hydrolase [Mycoplasma parvum]|uniref:Haloacid dehalogenase n=1 Tax=Mycoplasma parvum str. Indiana TaxID=1403316 RepID=U5NCV8_9MOLU|nr:HAD family hydrolase [Mycoplasma parvum]AGX89262.1 haloacid dehalogenase [Mycoplasma parvum str. Indiana]
MSNYKYIVISDLDGTLCTSQGDVSQESIEYLKKFQEKRDDVLFTFSTGRAWNDAKPIYEQLGLKSYISCLNGGYIYNPHTNHLISSCLSERFLKYLLLTPNVLSLLQSGAILTSNIRIPLDSDNPRKFLEAFKKSNSILVGIKFFYKDSDREKVREIIKNIKKFEPEPKVSIFYYPGLINLEIQSKQEDKFSFVEFVANFFGVPYSNILTFGDNHNDIPMTKGGVRSCALSNALFLLGQEATYISKYSNDEDGLIKELDLFFGPL